MESTSVYSALTRCLPRRGKHIDQWWDLTGKQLATLLEAAKSPLEHQYDALLFHYHWTVPYMGDASPLSDKTPCRGRADLGLDGSPIEYSWKWNTIKSPPDVRYTIENVGESAGTELDPLNHQGTRKMLHDLREILPGLDSAWSCHFLASMFDHDYVQYVKEAADAPAQRATTHMAIELVENGPVIKTYFRPQRLGQKGHLPLEEWLGPMRALNPDVPSRDAVVDFLTTNSLGKTFTAFGIGIDNIDPAKARIKWYLHTPNTSFDSVREIMTLGGKIAKPCIYTQIDQIHSLVNSVHGVPEDFPTNKNYPSGAELDAERSKQYTDLDKALSGHLYNFDVSPGKALPEVKLYIPTRHYGPDDHGITRALASWMEARGRGEYCEAYADAMERLVPHRHLDEDKSLHTFVSCAIKKGDIEVTSYLGAELFHPSRWRQAEK